MNFLDILILIPIAYGAYKGFKHGFVIELFTLLAILVGIYVGINFSDYVANWLNTPRSTDVLRMIALVPVIQGFIPMIWTLATKRLKFEYAARLRDEIKELKRELRDAH